MTERATPRSTGDEPITLAGRYQLEERIASGGMAQVWRAKDTVLGRSVAVKMLHAHLAGDPSFVERFRHEAVAAARLAHPSIVAIYDTATSDHGEAIVMELVEGVTLRELLDRKGRLDVTTACEIGAKVADALESAHRAGIVHRDVKPANILLCDDRRVKVADFGIAKALDQSDLTQQGLMVGTARYLSPEQVEGAPVDPRSDVYSLGVVLYECICGRPPFVADNDAAVALARLQALPLRPRQLRADVPREVEAVVMRALARRPEERYPTAADLRSALLGTLSRPGPGPTEDFGGPAPTSSLARPQLGPPPVPQEAPTFAQSERRWLVPALVLVTIAAALALAGLLLGQTELGQDLFDRAREAVGIETETTTAPEETDEEPGPITLASAVTFDPEGDQNENDQRAGQAIDGDPNTSWRTEGYRDAEFGMKSGVGIYFELADGPVSVDELVVSSLSEGWSASVFVADDPAAFADRSNPTATGDNLSTEARFDLAGAEGRYVLLWVTRLDDENTHRVEIAEVAVVG